MNWLVKLGTLGFFLHEHFHHKVESFGFRMMVHAKPKTYLDYKSSVYRKYLGTDDCLEEALANADIYRRLGFKPYLDHVGRDFWLRRVREYLELVDFPASPPGYRKAVDYLDPLDFREGQYLLQGQIKEATLTPLQTKADWAVAPRGLQSFYNITSHIWEIVPKGGKALLPSTSGVAPPYSSPRVTSLAQTHNL